MSREKTVRKMHCWRNLQSSSSALAVVWFRNQNCVTGLFLETSPHPSHNSDSGITIVIPESELFDGTLLFVVEGAGTSGWSNQKLQCTQSWICAWIKSSLPWLPLECMVSRTHCVAHATYLQPGYYAAFKSKMRKSFLINVNESRRKKEQPRAKNNLFCSAAR
jgi:hypothetical protein